ncbi:MAG: outer membrane lipoprotein-sorting protein [Elusimicrobia bacterium]|nr:outer membrane lipoprotein-sorting protein [Elusimicrobiota bacterium]
MRILRRDVADGKEQKFFVFFFEPADVARTVFMVWKQMDRDDDRWLYLPGLDLVRRIAATDKRSSFVGSHFVYEDVSGRSIEADTHELVGMENEAYKIRNTPKETKGVEFAYYVVWVDAKSFMPLRAEYYDAKDTPVRRITAEEIRDINGFPTVTRSVAEDLKRGGKTTLEFQNVRYDVGLDDAVFAERYLRKPPVEWTKP